MTYSNSIEIYLFFEISKIQKIKFFEKQIFEKKRILFFQYFNFFIDIFSNTFIKNKNFQKNF